MRNHNLNGTVMDMAPCDEIKGLEEIDRIIEIDQSPIGRTPRSNPATYTGLVRSAARAVRRGAGGAHARLRRGPLQLQREGRPLRGLPGRRPHQGRDALPAGRVRALRCVQGQALQPRDARDPLARQEHPRSAGDERRGCAAPVPERARRGLAPADADGRGPLLSAARARARPRFRAAKRSA